VGHQQRPHQKHDHRRHHGRRHQASIHPRDLEIAPGTRSERLGASFRHAATVTARADAAWRQNHVGD
jgi:hypothetical protein